MIVTAAVAQNITCPQRILFVHSRKSGGTSLTQWLASRWCAGFAARALPSPRKAGKSFFRVDHSEGVLIDLAWTRSPGVRLVTVLRDPVARAYSGFTYEGTDSTNFGAYYDTRIKQLPARASDFLSRQRDIAKLLAHPSETTQRVVTKLQSRINSSTRFDGKDAFESILYFEAVNYYVQLFSGELREGGSPSWNVLVQNNASFGSDDVWRRLYAIAEASLAQFDTVFILELFDDPRHCTWGAKRLGLAFGNEITAACAAGIQPRVAPPLGSKERHMKERFAARFMPVESACLRRLNMWDTKLYLEFRTRAEAGMAQDVERLPVSRARSCAQDVRTKWGGTR